MNLRINKKKKKKRQDLNLINNLCDVHVLDFLDNSSIPFIPLQNSKSNLKRRGI